MGFLTGAIRLLVLVAVVACAQASTGLQTFTNCRFIETQWADGDSFMVELPDGRRITARIYGADCIESDVSNESGARRLRAQRRYFGIGGGDAPASIARAREFGREASRRVAELLAEPFTIHTLFSDARGASDGGRVYAFVTTSEGRDLASLLVEEGLARAFGVTRPTPDGLSGNDYRENLRDLELVAAASRQGAWASTDWKRLAEDRARERREAAELAQILRPAIPAEGIDINSATAEQLVALEGIGPALAKNIIAARDTTPIRSIDDLARVKGLGPGVVKKISSGVRFDPAPAPAQP